MGIWLYPCINYRAFFTTGVYDCTNSTLCNDMTICQVNKPMWSDQSTLFVRNVMSLVIIITMIITILIIITATWMLWHPMESPSPFWTNTSKCPQTQINLCSCTKLSHKFERIGMSEQINPSSALSVRSFVRMSNWVSLFKSNICVSLKMSL